jgi:DNA-binding transcriptional ArsR family regulator
MQDVYYIDDLEQAIALLKPMRLEILRTLDEPRTCPELAERFGDTAQKVYYHIKALESARLVRKVSERRVRGTIEGHYQAIARSYWLAPSLVGQIGGETQSRDQVSLRALLSLAEEVIADTGHLGSASAEGESVPSLSMSGHLHLPDGRRRGEFMREVQAIFQELARKYGRAEAADALTADDFRLVLMCYPTPTSKEAASRTITGRDS